MKKVLLFILSITMVISTVLPIVPFSAATTAESEAAACTEISTAEELSAIAATPPAEITN